MGNIQKPEYDSTETPNKNNADWMKDIPDDTPLDLLTFVGTYKSVVLYGGDSSQSQSWSLENQFLAGIRAIDIRLLHYNGSLQCFNGPVDQKISFDDVEKRCAQFLKAHPTEFILMNIKEEILPPNLLEISANLLAGKQPKQRKFWDEVKYKIDWSDNFWRKTTRKIPNVKEVRGKILLLSGSYGIPENLQMKIPESDFKRAHTVFDLQAVWDQRKKHLKQPTGKVVRVTEVACGEPGCYPHTAAKNLNEWLYNGIDEFPNPCGVIYLSFPGTELISYLIDRNNTAKYIQSTNKGTKVGDGGQYIIEICIGEIRNLAIETVIAENYGLLVSAVVVNGKQHGASGGESSTLLKLENGEFITKISGNAGIHIASLDITTNKGNRLCSGGKGEDIFNLVVTPAHILRLHYSNNGINSICVFQPKV